MAVFSGHGVVHPQLVVDQGLQGSALPGAIQGIPQEPGSSSSDAGIHPEEFRVRSLTHLEPRPAGREEVGQERVCQDREIAIYRVVFSSLADIIPNIGSWENP
jgi:hypothetical protein